MRSLIWFIHPYMNIIKKSAFLLIHPIFVVVIFSMVFLAQFILSLSMGSIISAAGTTTAVIVAASVLSFCGSCSALFVTYLDL